MTTDIANIIKGLLVDSEAVFIDRVEGLVKPESETTTDATGKPTTSYFPVACIPEPESCSDADRKVVPDEKYRTVIYFEEVNAPHITAFNGHESAWTVTLRLICWINMQKFTIAGCSLSAPITQQIIAVLPIGQPINTSPYNKLKVVDVSSVKKGQNIFVPYSYNEAITKYLSFPFDCLGLDITVQYSINNSCKTLITLTDNDCII